MPRPAPVRAPGAAWGCARSKAFPIFKITPGSANSPAGADVTYTNLGTILTVTPRIAANNNVFLRVIPEVSDIAGQDKQTLDGKPNTANIYSIRRMDTSVMIPSGNTLVMGGMISDSHTKGMSKVPILGDAPLLGGLFRHQKKERQKLNLIAFITPTVVEDGLYQPNSFGSDFLKTKYPADRPDEEESAWNSAKPYDWTKPAGSK